MSALKESPHPKDPWTVLDPERHTTLFANRQTVTHQAGIPLPWLWSEHKRWLNAVELGILTKYGSMIADGKHGIVYLGKSDTFDPRVTERCWAATALFLRNGRPGGTWHLDKLASQLDEKGRSPVMPFLAVPNFAVDPPNLVPPMHRQAAVQAIRSRRARPNAFTVVAATSWELVAELYGASVVDDLKINYIVVGGAS
jgi:hypothetical protein